MVNIVSIICSILQLIIVVAKVLDLPLCEFDTMRDYYYDSLLKFINGTCSYSVVLVNRTFRRSSKKIKEKTINKLYLLDNVHKQAW